MKGSYFLVAGALFASLVFNTSCSSTDDEGGNVNVNKPVYLVIGSIIGIDTLMARSMGQNMNPNAYSSAAASLVVYLEIPHK